MKTIISGVLASVFFVTQTLAVAYAGQNQGNVNNVLTEDVRLNIANAIDERGESLQKTADQYGIEAAHQELENLVQSNMDRVSDEMSKFLGTISESDAEVMVSQLKNVPSTEQVSSILSDHGRSAKEKLEVLAALQNETNILEQLKVVKASAEVGGYKKAFSDVASHLRSRAWDSDWDRDDYSTAIAVIFVSATVLTFAALGGLTSTGWGVAAVFIALWLSAAVVIERASAKYPNGGGHI